MVRKYHDARQEVFLITVTCSVNVYTCIYIYMSPEIKTKCSFNLYFITCLSNVSRHVFRTAIEYFANS